MLFEEAGSEANRPLAELLNANVTLATPRLAKHYGLVPVKGDGLARYDLSGAGWIADAGERVDHRGDEARW